MVNFIALDIPQGNYSEIIVVTAVTILSHDLHLF